MSVFAGTAWCSECMCEQPTAAQAVEQLPDVWVVHTCCARCGHHLRTSDVGARGEEILKRYGAAVFDRGIKPFAGATAREIDESEDAWGDLLGATPPIADADLLDVGPCCACGTTDPRRMIRNFVALPHRAPVPGTGWGCLQCGAPAEGALAVVCDACLQADNAIVEVCYGVATEGQRAPRHSVSATVFEHDMSRHPDEL